MEFSFRIWKLEITIDVFDVDPSDRDIKVGIRFAW
jgi:hypothetical protein